MCLEAIIMLISIIVAVVVKKKIKKNGRTRVRINYTYNKRASMFSKNYYNYIVLYNTLQDNIYAYYVQMSKISSYVLYCIICPISNNFTVPIYNNKNVEYYIIYY